MNSLKDKIKIMGIGFNPYTQEDLSASIQKALLSAGKTRVIKANGEFLHRAMKDKEFLETMNTADICIADGAGVLWADKFLSIPATKIPIIKHVQVFIQLFFTALGLVFTPKSIRKKLPGRLSGLDVFYNMMESAVATESSVFYFGARPEVLSQAIGAIKKKMPGLKIAGYHDGYSDKGSKVIEKINQSKAGLLIVALGSPEQDYWIRDNIGKLESVRVAVGEGGSFDMIAGAARRAPKFIQKINLEWLWRAFTIKNLTNNAPHRFRRAWNAVPGFMWETYKWKVKND
jgi:N-acetylglucosaminyldiphosphoundecaprenol N-acetyl-beta-D-mannosaminyltransferase